MPNKEPLDIELGVTLAKLTKELARGHTQIEKSTKRMEASFRKGSERSAGHFKRVDSALSRTSGNMNRFAGTIVGALGVRELQHYADAWTVAGNKIAAAEVIAGRQARSLSAINDIADETRTGLTTTADLYAKLLRATKDVADSEEDVARATELTNKAFKAGGAAASEQASGILQLAQGLSSGLLQGDELRSIRENAPIIAQAIADEFGVTIGEVKKLGEEGQLTADRVFQAILNAQPKIEAAFSKTNSTIGEGFTALRNALTEYIGAADGSVNATGKIVSALELLAGNLDAVVIAGGILGGRFIGPVLLTQLTRALTNVRAAQAGLVGLSGAARLAAGGMGVLKGALGLLGGPFGLAIAALTTLPLLTDTTADKVDRLEGVARTAHGALKEFARQSKSAAEEQAKLEGKVSSATSAILNQSRATLQANLTDLREEHQNTLNDILGVGVFDVSAVTKPIDQIEDRLAQIARTNASNPVLEGVLAQLKALEAGNGDIPRLVREMDRLAGAGDEVIQVTKDMYHGLQNPEKIDLSQTIEQMVVLAEAIGGFDDELTRLEEADGPVETTAAATALSEALFDVADAGELIRGKAGRALLDMLTAAGASKEQIELIEAALKANADQMDEIIARGNPFDSTEDGAKNAKDEVEGLGDALKKLPKEISTKINALGSATDGVTASAALLRQFEGFRATPYNDPKTDKLGNQVGPDIYRVGFGSDTITLDDGSIQKVVLGMRVSVADANRDLLRRVEEFQNVVRGQIGTERFDSFTAAQQAALTSIAYNYGSLPDRIVGAVRDGSSEEIGAAIRGLQGPNGGVNDVRRVAEATIFETGIGIESSALRQEQDAARARSDADQAARQSAEDTTRALEEQMQVRLDLIALADQEVADAEFEASLIGKSAEEVARLRTEYRLLNDAKAKGIDVNEKIAGSELTYAEHVRQASEAVAQATRSLDQNKSSTKDFEGGIGEIGDAFADAVLEGEKFADSIKRIFTQIAHDILASGISNSIRNVFSGLSGALPSGTGGGSSGLFGGAIIPGILHEGGMAGQDGYSHGRALPASTWTGAPRFHTGRMQGLRPNEIATILEDGELVIPKGGFKSGAAGERPGMNVVIHNAPEGDHQVEMSPDGRQLEIMIMDTVTGPRGRRAMQSTYGVRPTARGR